MSGLISEQLHQCSR